MKVLMRERDLSEDYLRFAAQIGADGLDFHREESLPGVTERGYVDAAAMRRLRDKVRRYGLDIYRVTPPRPWPYLRSEAGGTESVDQLCRTIESLGVAGVPLMSMPVHQRWNPGFRGIVKRAHRGGYIMNAFDGQIMQASMAEQPLEWSPADIEAHYERVVRLYERVVPVAVESGVRLILHPSDPPVPEAEFSPRRWSSILDDVPSDYSGLLYCIGTRHETGVNIHEDIRAFARRGKIFHTHFRNVRGSIPTSGGYEEVALHDGDMNMFRVIQTLRSVGYDGGLQMDHLPAYSGDDGLRATAYAVGYLKALLAAVES